MLSDIRVISLAQQFPGPYCTLLLADLGADVILVEQPGGGDPARGPGGLSPFFGSLNRNKRSICLDLKSEAGREVLWRLLGSADAFVEGFRPGVIDRLGVGYGPTHERYPQLVYVSISGYGQTGPDRLLPGHDLSYQARAGLLGGSASDGEKSRPAIAIADLSSGTFAALAVAAGIIAARRNGVGRYIDLSMTDGLVSWMGPALESSLNLGAIGPAAREPAYGVFQCGDAASITLSIAFEDHFWIILSRVFGWSTEYREMGSSERRARGDELRAMISASLRSKTAQQWLEVLSAAGVPCGPVSSLQEVTKDEQLLARNMFTQGPSEHGGERWFVASPFVLDGERPAVHRAAPLLGANTMELLEEAGYSVSDVEELRKQGALGQDA